MELKFKVSVKIQKPVAEVFAAVHDPKKLSGYFTSGGSSGPLDEGKTVYWKFDEADEGAPVHVKQVVPNERIVFGWAASEGTYDPKTKTYPKPGGYDTAVEMTFEALGPSDTLVTIREGGWRETEGGLQGSYGNCSGWMHMACCLKAYVEHGINLRKGSF